MSRSRGVHAGAVAIAAVAATVLTACGGGSSGGSSSGSADTLTVGANSDYAPTGYDPLLYAAGQSTFYNALYDSLFVTDKDGKTVPSLATSFSTSADKLRLTLKLRDGVTFTDGSTLDATLVKKNLDRRTDKTLTSYGSFAAGGANEVKSVLAPDARTVVITWAKPQATGESNLTDEAGAIVGAKAAADPSSLKTTPDGSGAYTLDAGRTTKGSSYTLVKNTKAWNVKNFGYDTVVFKIITSPQALANALVSGQVTVAGQLDSSTLDLVSSRKKVVKDGGTIVGFPVVDKLGKTNPAFAHVEVRQALSYGIDRPSLVSQLHPGAKPTAQLFPAEAAGYDAALNSKYAYDPAKAKALLAQAGYPDGFSIDLVVLGQPTDDEVAVQKQWQKIGVKLNFKTASSTDAVFASVSTTPLLFGPFAVGNQPAGFVAGVLYGGFMNLQKAADPAIASALGSALGGTGSERDAALTKLNTAITDSGWYVPLYEDYIYYGYDSSKVAAPTYSGTNGYLLLSQITPAN
jgi:peptide/nickel transport system substrate-binding protein